MARFYAPRRGGTCVASRLLGLVTVLCLPIQLEAADRRWSNAFGGAFNAAANWSGGIPGTGDVAEFGLSSLFVQRIYTVDFDVDPINQAIHIEDDFVTFDLSPAHTYTTTEVSGNEIGNVVGRSGRLTITGGMLRVNNQGSLAVGVGASTTGVLTVTSGGRITAESFLFPMITIGSSGAGTLTVNNGGDVDATNLRLGVEATAGSPGTGTATITGAGSTLTAGVIDVGQSGTGTLNITSGGLVQNFFGVAEFNSVIGNASGSNGAVFINGTDSRWLTARNMAIGIDGQGSIDITSGGRLETTTAILGHHALGRGAVSVDGAASRWINANELTIGRDGNAALDITGGGNVQNSDGFIGRSTGSGDGSGIVTVHGAGSVWTNNGILFVGQDSEGTLSVEAGGHVTSITGVVGSVAGSLGTATVDGMGSTWTTSGNLGVGSGSLTISNGGAVVTEGLFGTLADASTSDAEVTVVGPGSSWTLESALLAVGDDGAATLKILNGGNVRNLDALVGADMGSTGTVLVSGAGSDWINSGNLRIGDSGAGTLKIEAGGSVTNVIGEIANATGSEGTVIVDGPGSMWMNGGNLDVGDGGDGTLTISNGGTVASASGGLADLDVAHAFVTVTGAGSEWNLSGELVVGDDGTATLSILNGGAVSNASATIGADTVAVGAVTVSGAGSTWTNDGSLTVGVEAEGSLTIADGGNVSSFATFPEAAGIIGAVAGSTGTVTVTGVGSEWTTNNGELVVGDSGSGSLHVEAGGSVTNRNGFVGRELGGSGVVTVSGAASTWTNEFLVVGSVGTGTLTIADGGRVVSDSTLIGNSSGSPFGEATVTGTGSTFSSGFLSVAHFGNGTLTVADGGRVSSARGFIGTRDEAIGAATISGGGSSWSTTEVFVVGFQAMAELLVQNGGSVSSNDAWIAGATTSTAAVTVVGPGSSWTIAGRLAISDAFDPEELGPGGGTGTLRIQPGATVTVAEETALFPGATVSLEGGTFDSASVSFNGGGTFNFLSGTLHVGTFNGNLTNQGGTLAPGHSAGSTTIIGNYTQQAGATLEIEIGGTSAGGSYDLVGITGFAILNGKLQLAMLDGFVPAPSDTFTVLNAAGGIFGVFSNITTGQRLTTSDGIGSFLVHYGPGSAFNQNQIVLSNFQAVLLPGDYNDNGVVDAADYTLWRDTLGQTGTGLAADGNGNDQVDAGDYSVWRAHFGQTAGSGSFTNSTVPEPATVVLLLVGVLAAFASTRTGV